MSSRTEYIRRVGGYENLLSSTYIRSLYSFTTATCLDISDKFIVQIY